MKKALFKNKFNIVLCTLLVVLLGLLLPVKLNAQQQFPVTVNAAIVPPYSAYLSDYISPGLNKLMVTLVFNDYNEPSWNVYLKIKIESNNVRISSKADFVPLKPITLLPGVPVQLSGEDLYDYFDFNNIDVAGISKASLISSGKLIEGCYRFCFEVYDYNKRVPISLQSCVNANIILNDPPQLTLPNNNAVVNLSSQNINFQWQLLGGNPTITKYIFSLYELESYNANPEVSIKENRALKVFESNELSNTSFMYDFGSPILKRGKKYAWQVRALTTNNREEFKNNGLSQPKCFFYGYPEGGSVAIRSPQNAHSFSLRDQRTFKWLSPDNLTPNQPYYYNFKVVKVEEGQTSDVALDNNTPVFTKKSQTLTPSNWGYEVTVTPANLFESNKEYAWRVTAHTNDQTIASSSPYNFYGPPLIEAFYAGNHTVYVTHATSSSISNLTGEGEVSISYSNKMQKVYFENIKVERRGALLVMTEGVVKAKYTGDIINLKPEHEPNGDATFTPDSVLIDNQYMRLKGVVKWKFPHPTLNPQNTMVESATSWIIFERYKLTGKTYLKDTTSYQLADPYGFSLTLLPSSYFVLLGNNNFKISFNGFTTLPQNVKTSQGGEVKLPFTNAEQLNFIAQESTENTSAIELVEGTGINLLASSYFIDLSDRASPEKKSAQKEWKGVYFAKSTIELPLAPDLTNQLFFKSPSQHTILDTQSSPDTCWVTTQGLQLRAKKSAQNPDSLWFNTFPGEISHYELKVTNSVLTQGNIKGNIEIPFLSEKKFFPFTVPLTVKGFATGYLNESLDGLAITFNPDGGEQRIDIVINRAVFANNQRLDVNATFTWPLMNVEMRAVEGLRIWGNGNIGFLTPNGSIPLTNQLQTVIKGFEINLDNIGCGRQGNLYAIGISSKIVMAEDVSGADGAPVANIYSIAKNGLLKGEASYSNFPDQYKNIIVKNGGKKLDEGYNSIGENLNTQTPTDSLGKHIFGDVNLDVASILGGVDSLNVSSIDSTLSTIAQKEETLHPAYASDDEVTVEKVIELIDLVSIFLDAEQQAKAQEFKEKIIEFDNNELVVLYRELQDLDQFVKKWLKGCCRIW